MTKKFLGPKRMSYHENPKTDINSEKVSNESPSCLGALLMYSLFFVCFGICFRFFLGAFKFFITAFVD